ncbi:uncharacterized protein LOC115686280 isoform X2 [Syzygium oleosum]|uniref:uncharacterized protein LOC115686280 isoform X2 n=1 Tax=Syzygium oleosum TaxID=219896 RepID=UPI0024BA61F1|nr:uncharacterized protein LOC115686280 isoform X2 [Syzygium oleosum]
MPILTANLGLAGSSSITLFAVSQLFTGDATPASTAHHPNGGFPKICLKHAVSKRPFSFHGVVRCSVSVSGDAQTKDAEGEAATASANAADEAPYPDAAKQPRWSADWKAARAYNDSGLIYTGRVEGFNGGGLLVRFYSLVGFLPFPQLSPSHSCKEPYKNIQEVAKGLIGSVVPVKINVGDIFQARVGSTEDYGAFVHLRFPDGLYHLTGLVHVSEVSWDLVQDVRDILREGDEVRVKVINVDREKSRITLSMKQLEEDPLLETLDKVIPQDGSVNSDDLGTNSSSKIDPLPGLETIIEELLREEGIEDVRINRQGFEKRVVSQDLQLWLSNAPPTDKKFILLARAGRQVQEIQLTTLLDQDGIKKALQRVLERVP